MSSLIQPNGMPGRSFQPKPSRQSKAEGELLSAAKGESHAAYMAEYRECLRALRVGEITRAECDSRMAHARTMRHLADRKAELAIFEARRQRVATAA